MSCDLTYLCRMWLQLTCAFEYCCCRRFEHGRERGSTTNRPRTSLTRRTGWKSASTGFAYTQHAPTGLSLFIIWAPFPPKKAFYFSDPLLHHGWLWNKTAVGKSWNECLIIKTLSPPRQCFTRYLAGGDVGGVVGIMLWPPLLPF